MKKILLTGIIVFSLALNLATVATLGWHMWKEDRYIQEGFAARSPLTRKDVKEIYGLWPNHGRPEIMELKKKFRSKRAEVLEVIAANPGNPAAAEKQVSELMALREQLERHALTAISLIMEKLPEEKRQLFLSFLKSRHGMRSGLGLGPGKHHRRMHRMGEPHECPAEVDQNSSAQPEKLRGIPDRPL